MIELITCKKCGNWFNTWQGQSTANYICPSCNTDNSYFIKMASRTNLNPKDINTGNYINNNENITKNCFCTECGKCKKNINKLVKDNLKLLRSYTDLFAKFKKLGGDL